MHKIGVGRELVNLNKLPDKTGLRPVSSGLKVCVALHFLVLVEQDAEISVEDFQQLN
jgi:hypothetical protein